MTEADPFDPECWQTSAEPAPGSAPASKKQRPPRPRRAARFLKGPVPWPWLARAMALPGKALAVGLMLWLQSGITKRRTVLFCLGRAAAGGVATTTARRAVRALEQDGLVAVERKPGRGLEVTILDVPDGYDQSGAIARR